jgi:hypothetical protein
MRVILSRKGFDSRNGGYPSPILPAGTMVSLPIPSCPSDDDYRYSELLLTGRSLGARRSYLDLMNELMPELLYDENTVCHLDPDIYANTLKRETGWRPCFGQIGAAQTHLSNQKIGKKDDPDDLFLFFGWFRRTEWSDGKLRFVIPNIKSEPDWHVIFGYLQIGKVITDFEDSNSIPDWIRYHPHMKECRTSDSTNAIYVARENLTWSKNLPGAGPLRFEDKLVLTKRGREGSRSKWNLPDFFRTLRITYHSEQSWKKDYFQSADIGQEFVIDESPKVEAWAKELIESGL